ncbi:alpha/beta fold hydrolase [Legionella fallonii]|uniref:AB hydrolase-1 domain-containing protein n=1 Tax=Legionella fallonii LLAP-10 TaxID=1212491 RepID=A0A098G8U7_9GAMM|nr:alpha/beta hydrolase [Legionella fallonii]CEG58898.1 exported protein of unknown function [Legionella fallonii LLAP-10]
MRNILLILALLINNAIHAGTIPEFYGSIEKVAVGKATLSYYHFGHGKPLVLVTGHGNSMTMWHPEFLKQLSEHREVIMFDYPGIGESTIDGAYPNSMEQLSLLVLSFIDKLKLDRPDILGFSMGGSLVLYMATQNSSRFDHLIVVGAKAGGKQTILPQRRYFDMLSDPHVLPSVAIKTLLFPSKARKQADDYLNILNQFPPQKMNNAALKAQAQAVEAENTGEGIWRHLIFIKNKVLVLNGTHDVLTPVENAVMITDAIPGAWLIQLRDTGHGVLFQEPEYSAKIIDLFLRS